MPTSRRPSKHTRAPRPLGFGHASAAQKADGRWIVRQVTGAGATKTYVCPGCARTIGPGVPHVVAWPSEPALGLDRAVDARRHWHSGCWQRKH